MPSIFLSLVNAEFSETRDMREFAFRRAGYEVIAQPTFPATASDTLEKLHHLIRLSDCVVHLVGRQLGATPNTRCVQSFLAALQATQCAFLDREQALRSRLGYFSDITYTQWEAFIALHLGKPLFIYTNTKQDAKDHPQREHLDRLLLVNKHAVFFDDRSLADRMIPDVLRHLQENRAESIGRFVPIKDDPPCLTTDSW